MQGDSSRSARQRMERHSRAQQRACRTILKEMRRAADQAPSKASETLQHARPWGANPLAYSSGRAQNRITELAQCIECTECHACATPISCDQKRVAAGSVTRNGSLFHTACFTCSSCNTPFLSTDEEQRRLEYYERDGNLLCAQCYRTRFGQQCALCSRKLLRWITHGGRVYCPKHDQEELPSCFGCGALLPNRGGVQLPDGRQNCTRCEMTLVVDTKSARQLLDRIWDFVSSDLAIKVPAAALEVEVELLDSAELHKRMRTQQIVHGKVPCCPLGLTNTLQDERLPVTSSGRPTVLPGSRRVGSVALLTALPEGLATATLAHEAGHVLLHLQGAPRAEAFHTRGGGHAHPSPGGEDPIQTP
jgi:hypothetical protein